MSDSQRPPSHSSANAHAGLTSPGIRSCPQGTMDTYLQRGPTGPPQAFATRPSLAPHQRIDPGMDEESAGPSTVSVGGPTSHTQDHGPTPQLAGPVPSFGAHTRPLSTLHQPARAGEGEERRHRPQDRRGAEVAPPQASVSRDNRRRRRVSDLRDGDTVSSGVEGVSAQARGGRERAEAGESPARPPTAPDSDVISHAPVAADIGGPSHQRQAQGAGQHSLYHRQQAQMEGSGPRTAPSQTRTPSGQGSHADALRRALLTLQGTAPKSGPLLERRLDPLRPMVATTFIARRVAFPDGADPSAVELQAGNCLNRCLAEGQIRCKQVNVFSVDRARRTLTIKAAFACAPEAFAGLASVSRMRFALTHHDQRIGMELALEPGQNTFVFRPDASQPLLTFAQLRGQVRENGLHAALSSTMAGDLADIGINPGLVDITDPVLAYMLGTSIHARWTEDLRSGVKWHKVLLPDWADVGLLHARLYAALQPREGLNPLELTVSRLFINSIRVVADHFAPRCVLAFTGVTVPTNAQAQSFVIVPYDSTIYNAVCALLSALEEAGLSPQSVGLAHFNPMEHGDGCYLDVRFHEVDPALPVTHQAMTTTALLASRAKTEKPLLAVPRADLSLRRMPSASGGQWTDQLISRAACPLCGMEHSHRRSLSEHMASCRATQVRFARCSCCRRSDHSTPHCPSIPSSLEVLSNLALSLHHELTSESSPAAPRQ